MIDNSEDTEKLSYRNAIPDEARNTGATIKAIYSTSAQMLQLNITTLRLPYDFLQSVWRTAATERNSSSSKSLGQRIAAR